MMASGLWRRWRSRGTAASTPHTGRWVVIDTETSGLDADRDTLLAIGGVAVDDDGVRIGDGFEVLLHNVEEVDRSNIVLHGIGRQAQEQGEPHADALGAFARWVADAPYVGFHSDFDRAVLLRAAAKARVLLPDRPWLDLAALAAGLFPEMQRKGRGSLDDWMEVFGIECVARHSAAGDAFATAELLLRLRERAASQRVIGHSALVRVARQQRWLGGQP